MGLEWKMIRMGWESVRLGRSIRAWGLCLVEEGERVMKGWGLDDSSRGSID